MDRPGQVLRTARLVLRPPETRDVAPIAAALADWEVVRWLSRAPHPYTPEDAATFVAANAGHAGEVWMIHHADGLCGCIGRRGEFGYWLARTVWGRGYATEAGRAVLAHHFAVPDASPLSSGYFEGNLRSRRVLETLGFCPASDRRVQARSLGREVVIKGMSLTRSMYLAGIANP
jgi:RimJ/RimL family protein N-acetyltransferase